MTFSSLISDLFNHNIFDNPLFLCLFVCLFFVFFFWFFFFCLGGGGVAKRHVLHKNEGDLRVEVWNSNHIQSFSPKLQMDEWRFACVRWGQTNGKSSTFKEHNKMRSYQPCTFCFTTNAVNLFPIELWKSNKGKGLHSTGFLRFFYFTGLFGLTHFLNWDG